jgi:hypothetical protein
MISREMWIVVAAFVALPIGALAYAQSPSVTSIETGDPSASANTDTQLELRQRRYIVLPRVSPEVVTQDAEAARQDLAAPARRDDIVRESRERPISRPELDHSVTSGLQGRNVLRALPR